MDLNIGISLGDRLWRFLDGLVGSQKLGQVISLLSDLNVKVDKMATVMDDLKREVVETKAKVQQLLDAFTAAQAALTQALADLAAAIAANDPAGIAQAATDLDAVQTMIDGALPPVVVPPAP